MFTLYLSDIDSNLEHLHTPPKKLFSSSKYLPELLKKPKIAIVGSRKITTYGRQVTTKLSRDLASRGIVIISGLALGVDSIAHASCIEAGGQTIAVLPAGLDRIYPSSHHRLAERIMSSGGSLVTEYPNGTQPLKHNFIARNRIIAGLADALVITEAAVNSGSLHTAGFALELGIPVFAVPGQITNPNSAGTNNLIRSGAVLTSDVEDILNEMGWQNLSVTSDSDNLLNTKEENTIIKLIKTGVNDGSELLYTSKLPAYIFNQTMTMLEISGKIYPLGANKWGIK